MGQILYPLEYAVAWIMVGWHGLLSGIGMDPASGWTWAFSIVGLVVVIRIILIPLFVKQIKASRGMQLIQPQMQAIQKKYKGKSDPESRQAMTQETMALYKESGTNPFASCLPIILQAPIFFALFRVLNQHVRNSIPIGPLTKELATQADNSTIFGAPLSATFLGSDDINVKIVTVILIIAMSLTTFTTQRQLMMKNMPAAALDNPFAKQQKMLMYVLPLVFAVSGVNFPIGVLIYWLTTNLWSMGQQFYVIRRMPAPGSLAEQAMLERKKKHGHGGGQTPDVEDEAPAPQVGQRVQPKRQPKAKRPPKATSAAAASGVEAGVEAGVESSPDGSAELDADTNGAGSSSGPPTGANDTPRSDAPSVNGTPKTPARKKPKSGR
ncbi:membrane protein insertase YidC [Angustibacter sp. McL0619]|uniref:membrane protein insertase YidC n=1 Tax=Angustibacter sp. McL0619 TaxID=3415676 RepID=UPI003CF3AC2B